jgi:hypothetical protein
MAAVGALLMSSGIALMATSTTAEAVQNQVGVCHATSNDFGNAYQFITPNAESLIENGHLQHRNNGPGMKSWGADGWWNGEFHQAGDAKPDFISDFTDKDGRDYVLDGVVTEEMCPSEATGPILTTASVSWVEPNCDNENTADYVTSGEHATFAVTEGSAAPGASIVVTATAELGYYFEGELGELDFPHTFGPEELNCTNVEPPVVEPPVVEPPAEEPATVETPTVVHAGLAGTTSDTSTGQEGLALMLAGLLLMAGAGGLVVAKGGERR